MQELLRQEINSCYAALKQPNWSIDSYRCYWEGRLSLARDLIATLYCKRERVKILHITPQTHIRSTQGDKLMFRIPQEQLRHPGYLRKMRLERYNQYKMDLIDHAADAGYVMGEAVQIVFFIPVPPSWRGKKKARHHLKAHQSKPDVDNLCKAFMDALKPAKDHVVHTLQAKKVWVDFPTGWIRIGRWPEYLSDIPTKLVSFSK